MAVVYVTNQSSAVDYTPLAKHGTIAFLSRGTHHPSSREVTQNIVTALVQSQPTDYLAVSGWLLESAIAVATWCAVHPTVPLLVWYQGSWILVPLSTSDLRKFFEEARDLLARR